MQTAPHSLSGCHPSFSGCCGISPGQGCGNHARARACADAATLHAWARVTQEYTWLAAAYRRQTTHRVTENPFCPEKIQLNVFGPLVNHPAYCNRVCCAGSLDNKIDTPISTGRHLTPACIQRLSIRFRGKLMFRSSRNCAKTVIETCGRAGFYFGPSNERAGGIEFTPT